MKKLSLFNKLVFFINSIFAVLLLCGYLLPYIPPHIFPALSVLSLVLPVLLLVNLIFFLFWLFKAKKQLLLSGLVLVLGLSHIFSLFHFGGSQTKEHKNTLSVLSFNVRQFNLNGWTEEVKVGERVLDFITEENPDIVLFQEYHPNFNPSEEIYLYSHKILRSKSFGQAIFSKYPIVNYGNLDFENTGNNAIFTDILVSQDTLRVYNVHFQSLRINANIESLHTEESQRLLSRIGSSFVKQEEQVKLFLRSEKKSKHPVIVGGDFNNSATSYMYRRVKGEKNDAFAKAGSGTGATFNFDFIPLRIDFILADPSLEVADFKTYDLPLSDHQPIKSTFYF